MLIQLMVLYDNVFTTILVVTFNNNKLYTPIVCFIGGPGLYQFKR